MNTNIDRMNDINDKTQIYEIRKKSFGNNKIDSDIVLNSKIIEHKVLRKSFKNNESFEVSQSKNESQNFPDNKILILNNYLKYFTF